MVALDRDQAAINAATTFQDARFSILHRHFSQIKTALAEVGIARVDGILLDLGISSPQVDDGIRGFSFRFDGPLDMRMDQSQGQTAAEFLAQASEQQLKEVIKHYGEERFAKQIARAIVAARATGGSLPLANLPGSLPGRSQRLSRVSIRRRAPFRLYGFSSTANWKSWR